MVEESSTINTFAITNSPLILQMDSLHRQASWPRDRDSPSKCRHYPEGLPIRSRAVRCRDSLLLSFEFRITLANYFLNQGLRGLVLSANRQYNSKPASLAFHALRLDCPAVGIDNLPAQGQSEA
jgi:hypothetical protein